MTAKEVILGLDLDRETTIRIIRTALKRRSGKQWRVYGGRGTAWGWITVEPRKTSSEDEYLTLAKELCSLLGLGEGVFRCYPPVSIPADTTYRREYIARACTGDPQGLLGVQYWD